MKRIAVLVLALMGACSSNNGASDKSDLSPTLDQKSDSASDVPAADIADSQAGDLTKDGAGSETVEEVPDKTDALGEVQGDVHPGDVAPEVWFDWLEDNILKEGCGNAIQEADEACDGGGKPCKDMLMNFISGTAYCKDDCTGWSTAGCITNGKPFCGNGIKEGLEACDSMTKPCTELGTGWKEGTATCSFDCRTWDIQDCKTDVVPYGYLDINFHSPCILNDDEIDDPLYMQEHFACLVQEASFTGSFGANSTAIPNPSGQEIISYALRDTQKNWLYVLQEAFTLGNGTTTFHNPQIEMHFAYPELVLGDYPLNFLVMGATRLYLFNYKSDGSKCLLAVGIGGHVTVTLAQDTQAAEGGQLSFVGQDIPIYHITESPYGQALVDGLQAAGICPKE